MLFHYFIHIQKNLHIPYVYQYMEMYKLEVEPPPGLMDSSSFQISTWVVNG